MKKLRKGITTGTCAAAAAKAAANLLLNGINLPQVELTLPEGSKITVPIAKLNMEEKAAVATVIKDGGDDPDVTNGAEIQVRIIRAAKYQLSAGVGVGIVTKAGLAVSPGQPAINPVPRQMIATALQEVDPEVKLEVCVSIPLGESLAKRTLNPKLGILGGLSILGTTGIVQPMSETAYQDSLLPQLDIAKAAGLKAAVMVPGRMGENSAILHLGVPEEAVIQTSNFIGFMLEGARDKGFKHVLLWGHCGKLLKVAAGNMQTHNRVSDARMETLTAHAALLGYGHLASSIMACSTAEAAVTLLQSERATKVLFAAVESARQRAEGYLFQELEVAVVFTNLRGNVLAYSSNLKKFLEEVAWQQKFTWLA